jgi:hypothetical protein
MCGDTNTAKGDCHSCFQFKLNLDMGKFVYFTSPLPNIWYSTTHRSFHTDQDLLNWEQAQEKWEETVCSISSHLFGKTHAHNINLLHIFTYTNIIQPQTTFLFKEKNHSKVLKGSSERKRSLLTAFCYSSFHMFRLNTGLVLNYVLNKILKPDKMYSPTQTAIPLSCFILL